MGHRANFVVIKDGHATAYEDNWAALGCVHDFAAGLNHALEALKLYKETDALMDWAFAEGGYLIDHDQKTAIVFGESMDCEEMMEDVLDLDFENELADLSDGQTEEDPLHTKLIEGDYLGFLQDISSGWEGWLLCWDNSGVDSFSKHLELRGIHCIETAPASQPEDTLPPVTHRA